jgi:hypothetical protein
MKTWVVDLGKRVPAHMEKAKAKSSSSKGPGIGISAKGCMKRV